MPEIRWISVQISCSDVETVRERGPSVAKMRAESRLRFLHRQNVMQKYSRTRVIKTQYAILFTVLICLLAALPVLAQAQGSKGSTEVDTITTSQRGDPLIPQWATGVGVVVGTIGGPVFAVWYAWYMTTIRVPAIETLHQNQLAAAEARTQLLIANFRLDMETAWRTQHEGNKELAQAIEKLAERFYRKGSE